MELTKELSSDETRLLELFRKAAKYSFAELTVKVQNGKLMTAEVTEKIKLA